ncbi:MAG: RHS repeat-associated core domain-containing protein, partial [Phycisphaerae bacterium]
PGLTAVLYTGQVWDAESGLHNYRNRYYHPGLGRFLARDPAGYGDGMNLYAYVRNNPLRYTDPDGLMARSAVNWLSNTATSAYSYASNVVSGFRPSTPAPVTNTSSMTSDYSSSKFPLMVGYTPPWEQPMSPSSPALAQIAADYIQSEREKPLDLYNPGYDQSGPRYAYPGSLTTSDTAFRMSIGAIRKVNDMGKAMSSRIYEYGGNPGLIGSDVVSGFKGLHDNILDAFVEGCEAGVNERGEGSGWTKSIFQGAATGVEILLGGKQLYGTVHGKDYDTGRPLDDYERGAELNRDDLLDPNGCPVADRDIDFSHTTFCHRFVRAASGPLRFSRRQRRMVRPPAGSECRANRRAAGHAGPCSRSGAPTQRPERRRARYCGQHSWGQVHPGADA